MTRMWPRPSSCSAHRLSRLAGAHPTPRREEVSFFLAMMTTVSEPPEEFEHLRNGLHVESCLLLGSIGGGGEALQHAQDHAMFFLQDVRRFHGLPPIHRPLPSDPSLGRKVVPPHRVFRLPCMMRKSPPSPS